MEKRQRTNSHDMTEGGAAGHLLLYSVPLMLGNFFQLTYNAADSIIAGRFIGKEALAAEGIVSPLMNLIILGITGICIGAGVFMSELFGAKRYQDLKREMATMLLAGFFCTAAAVCLGIWLTVPVLKWMQVPEEVLSMTAVYLRIIFLGMPFTFVYNALAAALKSVGDSATPLKFLACSAILNAALDLIFIAGLGFGIACSAATTVIAEAVSAGLAFCYINRHIPLLRLARTDLKIAPSFLKKTVSYGAMTALQQSIQPVAKLMIQGAVNGLGVDMIALYNAVTRVDDFAYTPEQSIAHGITTFAAQNRGAGKPSRVSSGFYSGLMLECVYWVLLAAAVLLFRRPILSLFLDARAEEAVINAGVRYLGIMALMYVLPALTNSYQGFFRGVGNMKITALCTLIQAGLRAAFTYLLVPHFGIYGIPFACMTGWGCMLLYEIPAYARYQKAQNSGRSVSGNGEK